ncbi:MAG: tail fiber protein [Chloroflexi bacterium]|nr:tail fiber protein [Chloroflexota bacterium]
MDPFIGEIRLLPYNFAPIRWALCDGSSLQIAENQALFALIGTVFGGDGQTTFSLPDLRESPLPAGTQGGYYIALEGVFPQRN